MSDHAPSPLPDRAVYGFSVFLFFKTLFLLYVSWIFIPKFLKTEIGLTYLPDKYFALFIPILILYATNIFAFSIYPSVSLFITPNIDDKKNYTLKIDQSNNVKQSSSNKIAKNTNLICDCQDKTLCFRNDGQFNNFENYKEIPALHDLDLTETCNKIFGS